MTKNRSSVVSEQQTAVIEVIGEDEAVGGGSGRIRVTAGVS